MRFTILNHRPVSWNRIATLHWRKYQALRDEVFLLTRAAMPTDAEPFEVQVDITITGTSNRPVDADNIAAKLYIDAMRSRLLVDDDPNWVRSVTTLSCKGQSRVEIEIREITHAETNS